MATRHRPAAWLPPLALLEVEVRRRPRAPWPHNLEQIVPTHPLPLPSGHVWEGGGGGGAATLADASQGVCAAACSGSTATDGAVSPPPAAVRAPRSEQPSSCRLVLIAPALLLWGPIRSRPISCLLRPLGARRWGSLSSISLFLLSVPPPSSPAVPSPLSPLPSLSVRCSVPGLAFARCACRRVPLGTSAGAAPPAVDPRPRL